MIIENCENYENYANINDVEYILGDIDKYYAPILTSPLFDKGYQ